MILYPTRHYRTLPAYLRAIDRVVSVSSGADIFPLPHTAPLPGSIIGVGGVGEFSGANGMVNGTGAALTWTATESRETAATAALGSDESLGGALLTPISWLRSTDEAMTTETGEGEDGQSDATSSITTNMNGTGGGNAYGPRRGDRAVTQGELIRQEQEAGIVPTSQTMGRRQGGVAEGEAEANEMEDDKPHARGPDLVGVEDMGLQDGHALTLGRKVSDSTDSTDSAEAAEGPKQAKENEDGDGDIVLTDADGQTEGDAAKKADISGENVGPDAVDTTAL